MSAASNPVEELLQGLMDDAVALGAKFVPRPVYQPRAIKRRSTKSEVAERRLRLRGIVAAGRPMTVRQVYYQATVENLVDKTEAGYGIVKTDLALMRRGGQLPYSWLADNTRWQRKPQSYSGIEQAVAETAKFYRKALWDDADCYVEVWIEKDALAGVVLPVTALYDVPLMVARGYASLSFLHSAGEYIASLDVPAYIYHLGDFDPSGQDAARKIEEDLRGFAPNAEIHFERLAVTPEQIAAWNLPTRPTKKSDTRSKGFGDVSVELDAIHPNKLRQIVENAINRQLPKDQLATLQLAEQSEREALEMFAETVAGGAA